MSKFMYLVNPSADFPTYFGTEVYAARGFKPVVLVADLAIPTVAAMAPPSWKIQLHEESLAPVDFDVDADFVGITGKVNQWCRMRAIADEFRRRGKTVVIGGPFASLCPEIVRPHCDVLVRGEIENLHEELFADLESGRYRDEYIGDRPDLSTLPLRVPRWDLMPNDRSLWGMVQTSRGCPFECEFCDVIQYLGRKQRHKTVAAVLAELDVLYEIGYRQVFLADDNFAAYRGRCKELLSAMADWNDRQAAGRVQFVTQVSIDAASDDELLALCARAGVTQLYIGIETPNEESLRSAGKRQNLRIDLVEQIERIVRHGIVVMGGMIVGFDADGPDIFERQYRFAQKTPVAMWSLGLLVAPAATPLHERLRQEGRLRSSGLEIPGLPWDTNIKPLLMPREEMLRGIETLTRCLYDPEAYGDRVTRLFDLLPDNATATAGLRPIDRRVERDCLALVSRLRTLGRPEREMWMRIREAASDRPSLRYPAISSIAQYMQIRHLYQQGNFWDQSAVGDQLSAAPSRAS